MPDRRLTGGELLRRVDWRFLLPLGDGRRALCLGRDRTVAAALAAAGMQVLARPEPSGADIVAAVGPRSDLYRLAQHALRPGGSAYFEWSRPVLRGRLVRQLEQAGFVDVRVYWLWPSPRRAHMWVPLGDDGAVGFFLARRGSRSAIRALWRVARGANVLAPVCATARKPRADPEMAAPVASLLLTPGTRSVTKAVELVFADGERVPQLVVKHARTARAGDALRREAANLRSLDRLPAGRPPGTPECVFVNVRAGGVALGETFVDGAPLFELLTPASHRTLALAATDWLAGLRHAHAAHAAPVVARVLEGLGEAFPAADRDLADLARSAAARIDGPLPVVFEQRDFSPWNVLVDGRGRLGVLDWESAEPDGVPLLDLLYFLTYSGFLLDGASSVEACRRSYARTRDRSTPTGAVAAACIERYGELVGIEPGTLVPFRALTWLVHLRNARAGVGSTAPDGHVLPSGESLFLALLRDELTTASSRPAPARALDAPR